MTATNPYPEYHAAYYQANRERILAYQADFRVANKERLAAASKAYREKNKEKLAARRRVWIEQNREQVNAALRRGTHRRRARKLSQVRGEVTGRDLRRILLHYRSECAYCKSPLGRFHWDHVIPLSRGGDHAIGNLVPACGPCNQSKGAKLVTEWKRDKFYGEGA